jgi:hypothetical protein
MLLGALGLFAIAAIFGLYVLSRVLLNKHTPKPAVVFHGGLALLGLLILITYAITGHGSTLLYVSIALFVFAAMGGFYLFTIDMSKKPIPKFVAVIHPLVAITAITALVIFIFQTMGSN